MSTPMQITLILVIVLILIDFIMRRVASDRITRYFAQGSYDELLKFMDSFIAKMYLHPFNRDFVRMNAYIAKGDDKHALEVCDRLLNALSPASTRSSVLPQRTRHSRSISMPASTRDAKKMLKLIEARDENEAYEKSCRQMYEIIANRSSVYLDDMLEELPDAKGERKAQLLSLIALQYGNRGQQTKAKIYTGMLEDMAKEGLKAMAEKKAEQDGTKAAEK
jgi:hypothetical protein